MSPVLGSYRMQPDTKPHKQLSVSCDLDSTETLNDHRQMVSHRIHILLQPLSRLR